MAETLEFGTVVEEAMQSGVDALGWDAETEESVDSGSDDTTSEVPLDQVREHFGDRVKDMDDEALKKLWEDTEAAKEEEADGDDDKQEAELSADADKPEDQQQKEDDAQAPALDNTKVMSHELTLSVDGRDETKTVEQWVRMAQRTPMLERRNQQLLDERNEFVNKYNADHSELEQLRQDSKFWTWVLDDATGKRFLQAREQYEKAQLNAAPPQATDSQPAGSYTQEQVQQGEHYYRTTLQPIVQEMARTYSRDGGSTTAEDAQYLQGQIENALFAIIAQETVPGRQVPQQRLRDIFMYDLPARIQAAGWKLVQQQQQAGGASDAQMLALKAELANLKRDMAKSKLNRAPDGGSGGQTPPADMRKKTRLDEAKTFDDFRAALDDPDETFGM